METFVGLGRGRNHIGSGDLGRCARDEQQQENSKKTSECWQRNFDEKSCHSNRLGFKRGSLFHIFCAFFFCLDFLV